MSQAAFTLQGHNPDVLTCIANLSNDEVFTPPEFANQMLDTLAESWASSHSGENIWSNKDVTFLDPCTKSGVFLREIVKRLNDGLTREIPDLTERINHILTKQVFGIGITELTSLLARRSVYCSKYANGIHSIARTFTNNDGLNGLNTRGSMESADSVERAKPSTREQKNWKHMRMHSSIPKISNHNFLQCSEQKCSLT